jgi:hypothetical protein
MSKSLIVEVSVVETPLKAGESFKDYLYTLTPRAAGAASRVQEAVAQSVVFEDVAEGDYAVTVRARTPTAMLGSPVTADVTVGPAVGPQTYMAPSGLGLLVV